MTFPVRIYSPEQVQHKAALACRRSPVVWPYPADGHQFNVRLQARMALLRGIRDYWDQYRDSKHPDLRAKFRSYLRAMITAIRLLY